MTASGERLPGPASGCLQLYVRLLYEPRRAMNDAAKTDTPVTLGLRGVSVTGITYLLVYYFLAHNGGRPTVFTPWLAIPAEQYYRYNFWLHVPSLLLAWVSSAAFAHLAARAMRGVGSFEGTLSTLGLGIGVASMTTGLHDIVTTFVGYVGVLDQRAYEDALSTPGTAEHALIWTLMALYSLAFELLFTFAISSTHRLSLLRSFVAATVGFIVYQMLFVLFNR